MRDVLLILFVALYGFTMYQLGWWHVVIRLSGG
jgi:hypothetical protein